MHEKKPLNYEEIAIVKGYKYGSKLKMTICKKYNGTYYNHSLDDILKRAKGTVNTQKLDNNLSRAKNMIIELALSNPWTLFGTFTIDKEKHDRDDLKGYYLKFSQWLRNYNKKHDLAIKYLFVPERHKNGSWHMHGFIFGLPESHLIPYKQGDKTKNGKAIKRELWEKEYLNWTAYSEKFGFNTFGIIKNHEATSYYVTKYLTKDVQSSVNEVNAKSYYCSKGLEKATEYIRGYLAVPVKDADCDFTNDYVKIINFDKKDLSFIMDNIVPLETNINN